EGRAIACWIELLEEGAIVLDRLLDEIPRGRGEDRPALGMVAVEQGRSAPAAQYGREFPAEIAGILEAGVDAVSAVRRMAVGGVPCDEDATAAIAVGDRETQVPEADVLEFGREGRANGTMQVGQEVEIVLRGAGRHGRVEEPRLAEIDAAEKLPVAAKVRMQHVVVGLARKTLEKPVQL